MSEQDYAYNSSESHLKPLSPEDWPNIDHIKTEDDAPVDGVFSEKQMRLLTGTLYDSWRTEKSFVALANVGLFYGIDISPIVPDVLLSVNVRMPENLFPKLHRSYFVWKYGKPPEVTIEIVSNKEGGEDSRKLDIYADVRVSNYVIYDPEEHLSDTPLRLFRLNGSKLVEDKTRPIQFEELGLGLTLWNGRFEETDSNWLRWTDNRGKLIPTGGERAESEALRAEVESERAAKESQRAVKESQRALKESERAAKESQRAVEESQRADLESQRAAREKERADLLLRETQRLYELLKEKGIDPGNALGDALSDASGVDKKDP